ncbi:zinc finger protein 704-like [Montipora capricornis]|uniref:zinc finger protein 704-like n=1 Tax=Montipora capricornis TaxID=246305 RepID=UPI0035F15247
MCSLRRRPQNSLLGTRVSAAWKDGYFYSGVIEAVKSRPTGESTYTILFEDDYIAEVDKGDIVGPGFQAVCSTALKNGQPVFISFKGREVAARVVSTRSEFNEVLVQILDQQDLIVAVNPEDIHLMRGVKFSGSMYERETASSTISCPHDGCKENPHGIAFCHGCTKRQENVSRSEEMAALVLTALSISPVFKDIHPTEEANSRFPLTPDSGSEMALYPSPASSPAHCDSPTNINDSNFFINGPPSPVDEGIGVDFQRQENTRKRKSSTSSNSSLKTLYKCTWPGCGKTLSTAPGIIRHVRTIHLGPKSSVEDGYSDGEEDFYFNEIGPDDEYSDSVFPPPLALSPTPTQSHFDMVKSPWSEPGVSAVTSPTYGSLQHPRFNWDAQAISQFSYTQSAKGAGKVNHPARVLSHPGHHTYRKLRGESKKCRKVYGMENRHMWCTQCRWKKACVRFAD